MNDVPSNTSAADSRPAGDSSGLRELLAAVAEAIDLPHAATMGDRPAYLELLFTRAMHATIALRAVLADEPGPGAAWHAEYLRQQTAKHPADGYRHSGGAR